MISFSINVQILYSDGRRYMFTVYEKKTYKKDEKKGPFWYMPNVFFVLSLCSLAMQIIL